MVTDIMELTGVVRWVGYVKKQWWKEDVVPLPPFGHNKKNEVVVQCIVLPEAVVGNVLSKTGQGRGESCRDLPVCFCWPCCHHSHEHPT